MDEGPHRVELLGGGWSGPIGYCNDFTWTTPCRTGDIRWEKITSPAFIFSQTAALLVTQGMKLSDLFPPDVCFVMSRPSYPRVWGPFILLKGELSKPESPPLRLKNLVLAHVDEVPPGMPMDVILAALLRDVQ